MHARIIHKSGLVDIDVQAVIRTHLERSLHRIVRPESLRGVSADSLLVFFAYFRQAALGIIIFLSVIVTRNPPCGMVTGQGELGKFLLDDKIVQVLLRRKLVAESQSVIIETETYRHLPSGRGLHKIHKKLIVIVAYLCLLSPYRLPSLVKRRSFRTFKRKSVMERIRRKGIFLAYCAVRLP